MDRNANLARVAAEQFDLVIVGGGITGACLAFDATTRGLKTALIEKRDFGHATSAASSKLLHGGIRFLQQLRIDKVRESAFERIYFQNLVPHLCRYVPFVIPTFKSLQKGKAFLGAGAVAYSLVSAGQNAKARFAGSRVSLPRIVNRAELSRLIPWLDDRWPANGGLVLPECHMNSSERATLALVQAAAASGCAVCNYTDVVSVVERNGKVAGIEVNVAGEDKILVKANAVANCAGPWLGKIDGSTSKSGGNTITSFFRGSHLVIKGLDLQCALALPTAQKIQGMTDRGGRHVFLIPWRNHLLLGTSYAQHNGSIDEVNATAEDREQLLDAVNGALGSTVLSEDNVVHSYAGIYPLTAENVQSDVYQGASDFIITDHGENDGLQGFFSLFGAKFTTARKLAEVACDSIAKQLGGKFGPCITRSTTVPDADVADPRLYIEEAVDSCHSQVPAETVEHLYANYGTRLKDILSIAAEHSGLSDSLSGDRPNIEAEAVYCARHEMVEHLSDFVFRRTGLGTIGDPGTKAIETSARLIAIELGWDISRTQQEIDDVNARLRTAGATP